MPIHSRSRNLNCEIMLERRREGVQRAKREGKYKGRAPTARAKAADIVRLAGEGMKRQDIAARLGVGVESVYRVLAKRKAAALTKRAAWIGASFKETTKPPA
jgi:DNA invertase Pin-like site-specific DNA recombinase